MISVWTQSHLTQCSKQIKVPVDDIQYNIQHSFIDRSDIDPLHNPSLAITMLDCCEKKVSTDAVTPAMDASQVSPQRPMNERKVSFHRRFVESQKELKIVQAKL
jgi:hypothetical protein